MSEPRSRRRFLQQAAATVAAVSLGAGVEPVAFAKESDLAVSSSATYASLLARSPSMIVAFTEDGTHRLTPGEGGQWHGGDGITVAVVPQGDRKVGIGLTSPKSAVKQLHVRWERPAGDEASASDVQILGDAWERGYGDLEWRGIVPERPLFWYFAAHDVARKRTECVGVETGPSSFCFFQADAEGMSLWTDVRSGGRGVALGDRHLAVCTVVGRDGREGESPFAAVNAFCHVMCAKPRLPKQPIYGHNDWYYAYGNNSHESILADARRIVGLAPTGGNRPFCVIDDGWQARHGSDGGPWDKGNSKFPDMPGLAAQVKQAGARPGIWIRPLAAAPDAPASWRLPRDHAFLDPTVPEARAQVAADIARLHGWGYELIKHDFSTYDITGRWGFAMKPLITNDGWTFAEGNRRTTAEVILDLYAAIREGAADSLVLGCNTVSHLSAGLFEGFRVGDDTSGRDWERTRRMGINCLAFRAAQHGAFYDADPDCVGVTTSVPWELNRQWLDLVARSGTSLFVSLSPDAVGPQQEKDLRAALAAAAAGPKLGQPLDWLDTTCPSAWELEGKPVRYKWIGNEGASPFGA